MTTPTIQMTSLSSNTSFTSPNGAVINHNHAVKNNAAKKPSVDTLLIQTKMQPN